MSSPGLPAVSRFTLLTGAGFTHNFGTPLSTGLGALILNRLQSEPELQELLRAEDDFETAYSKALAMSEAHRSAMINAVGGAFGVVDDFILGHCCPR